MANTTNFSDCIKLDKETVAVMLEAECIAHDPNVKRYSDVEEAIRELKR